MGAVVLDGRFELRGQVVKGGMGSVHRGIDLQTGRDVAIKIPTLRGDLDVGRFAREAALLGQLDHPNIVRYVAHGQTAEGVHYLVQDWVDGPTVGAVLRGAGLRADEAMTLATALAAALAAAHALGVVHRDIKPDNILLVGGEPAQVRLVDFGIARLSSGEARLTMTGTMVGSPTYMAPEQARGEKQLGPQADVWALGAVLYEALTGRPPFAGPSMMATRAKILFMPPPPLREVAPELPAELDALLERLLQKEPADRPADGAAVGALLATVPPLAAGPRRPRLPDDAAADAPAPRRRAAASTGPDDGAPRVTRSFVFISAVVDGAADGPDPNEPTAAPSQAAAGSQPGDAGAGAHEIRDAAARHGLTVHQLLDGTCILEARAHGAAGARAALDAALAVAQQGPTTGVSVVATADDADLPASLDRAARAVEQASMSAIFAGIVDGARRGVEVGDEVVALLDGAVPGRQRSSTGMQTVVLGAAARADGDEPA